MAILRSRHPLNEVACNPFEQGFRAANGFKLGNDIVIDDGVGGDFHV